MDDVPPGMGPIEFRALCRAQVDPARLQAVRDRVFEKFSKFPGGIYGPPIREWHPPPSPTLSHSGDSTTGLPSPSNSECGDSANPLKQVADATGKEGASVSNDHSTEGVSRSPVTPKQSKKTCSGKDSRMSKTERRKRKIMTRTTRSKGSSTTSLSELDETEELGVESRSTAAVTPLSGDHSPRLEHLPGEQVPQTSTKTAPSKRVAKNKRKRDEDEDSNSKRARIRVEPFTGIPYAPSGPLKSAPTHFDIWLEEQKSVYKPKLITPKGNNVEGSTPTIQHTVKAQEPLLSDPKSRQIPESVTPNQIIGPKIDESALHMLITRNRNSRHTRNPPSTGSGHSSKASRKSTSKPPAAAKPSGVEKRIMELKKVHHRKVEDLLSAVKATDDYCKALDLEDVSELAKLYLNEVFHHPFPEYHPTHAIIVSCIIFAYGGGGNKLRSHTGLHPNYIFSPDVPRTKCGPAIAAVRQFFLSQDSKRMRPKATRRGPTPTQQSSQPSS